MIRTHWKSLFAATSAVVLLTTGCHHDDSQSNLAAPPSGHAPLTPSVASANTEFLTQKTFDPWILTSVSPTDNIPIYVSDGTTGKVYNKNGASIGGFAAGKWNGGMISSITVPNLPTHSGPVSASIDMKNGVVQYGPDDSVKVGDTDWPALWKQSDIEINGDPEAQQVTRANLFYLLSTLAPNSQNSIAPMGLSSNIYAGHIFWDAEVWMFPALLAQHPDRARSIINYRFIRLAQAQKNAATHHFQGAEYPWESAESGKEEAPVEFSQERHITADVAYAAWQYYLWTGDKEYLRSTGWPIIKATATYWMSRVSKTSDKQYHVAHVVGPDETAGIVTDDAWTNGVVAYNLRAAVEAANVLGEQASPKWSYVADKLTLVFSAKEKRYVEYADAPSSMSAKQANTQMLIYPLGVPMTDEVAGNTLDYCLTHTIKVGPAMTSCIDATVAARFGRAQQSLDLFHDSYRPFMRTGLAAFSEKRTANRVYFCTGMGGCLQTVIYGFGGLNVAWGDRQGKGTLVASDGDTKLYADPHLPPGWSSLVLRGVQFHGMRYTITVQGSNKMTIVKG